MSTNEMESQFHPSLPVVAAAAVPSRCPFHDGPATLDALLAELSGRNAEALDVALDLRSAWMRRRDAGSCVRLALRLRHALNGSHYLAFYRVRQWLQRVIVVQVRPWRGAAWQTFPLPLNSARLDEIENACRSAWLQDHPHADAWGSLLQTRFVFLVDAAAPAPSSPAPLPPSLTVA